MPFDPNEPRDEIGRWTSFDATSAIKSAASDSKLGGETAKSILNEAIRQDPKLSRWGVDPNNISNTGEYVLYHGTNMNAAKSIKENGLKPPEGASAVFFMLTTEKNNAKLFAKGQDDSSGFAVIEVRIPVKDITSTIWKGHQTSGGIPGGNNDTQHAIKGELLPPKYIKEIRPVQ